MGEPMYIRQNETESIKGDRIILYYFTVEKSKLNESGEEIRYGVGIDMYTQLPGERTLKERKISEDIFKNKREAEKFIDVLCRCCVTPATLNDVVEDYIIA